MTPEMWDGVAVGLGLILAWESGEYGLTKRRLKSVFLFLGSVLIGVLGVSELVLRVGLTLNVWSRSETQVGQLLTLILIVIGVVIVVNYIPRRIAMARRVRRVWW